jgi:septal ring factor EnvC (AmiA/AmiB activator)
MFFLTMDRGDGMCRKEASAHVRQHLSGDMEDAKRRLEMVQQEIELINAQLEQQRDKDRQVDAELAEKAQRRELVTSTRNNLSIERDKIRLMVAHFAPKHVDVDKVLDC